MQDFTELHVADFQLQRFPGDAQKMIRRIGQCYLQIAGLIGRGAERLSI